MPELHGTQSICQFETLSWHNKHNKMSPKCPTHCNLPPSLVKNGRELLGGLAPDSDSQCGARMYRSRSRGFFPQLSTARICQPGSQLYLNTHGERVSDQTKMQSTEMELKHFQIRWYSPSLPTQEALDQVRARLPVASSSCMESGSESENNCAVEV